MCSLDFFLPCVGWSDTVCVVVALWPALKPLHRAVWSFNSTGASGGWNSLIAAWRVTEVRRVSLVFDGGEGGKDLHFWPFKERLHWPIKKWKISPCKPLTVILTGQLSSDLFQAFPLNYLNVSWRSVGLVVMESLQCKLKVIDSIPETAVSSESYGCCIGHQWQIWRDVLKTGRLVHHLLLFVSVTEATTSTFFFLVWVLQVWMWQAEKSVKPKPKPHEV